MFCAVASVGTRGGQAAAGVQAYIVTKRHVQMFLIVLDELRRAGLCKLSPNAGQLTRPHCYKAYQKNSVIQYEQMTLLVYLELRKQCFCVLAFE